MLTQSGLSIEEIVSERIEFLKTVGLWPSGSTFNHRSWLDNFTKLEKKHAYMLLSKFIYISEELCVHYLESALTKIGGDILDYNQEGIDIGTIWKDFINNIQFCAIRGEIPNETDSGLTYLRMVRKRLKIPQSNIHNTDKLLLQLYTECKAGVVERDIVFIDDFIGTGNQFVATWYRMVNVENEMEAGTQEQFKISFNRLSQMPNCKARFFCCTVVGVQKGIDNIMTETNKVHVRPAHVIDDGYSLLSSSCNVFKPAERQKIIAMLQNIAIKQEMKDDSSPLDWRGYEGLGLSIGVRDMIPDSSLAVYRWNYAGWVPLID